MRDALGAALQSGRTFSLRPGRGVAGLIGLVILAGTALIVFVLFKGIYDQGIYAVAGALKVAPVEINQYLLYLIGGFILIRTGRALYFRTVRKANRPRKRTGRPLLEWRFMGSATFAYDAELERAGFYARQPGGIPLGYFHRWHDLGHYPNDDLRGDAIYYHGDRHGLTIAPTRGGKGESFIIPTALTYEGSLFVIDPKGQAASVTARQRARPKSEGGLGQKVYILNPWNLHAPILNDPVRNPLIRSAHFNPLLGLVGVDDADQLDGAMLLAEALIPKEPGEDKPFFPLSGRDLLVALILYVVTAEGIEDRSLCCVRRILTDPDAMNAALNEIMGYDPSSIVRQKAARFTFYVPPKDDEAGRYVLAEQESVRDVYATVVVNTSLLDSPILARTMGDSDFSFEELKSADEPITVYLVIPASRIETYNRWLRLLVSVALQSLIDARDKPPLPVLFILDEFYQLGELQKVQDAMSLMAGYGVKLWPIVQDLNQLRARYNDKLYETFISNAGCIQMFKPNDNFTAEYFSKRMGDMTDWGFSTNESYASGTNKSTTLGGSGQGTSSSSTSGTSAQYSESFTLTPHKRRLRNPDELTRMDRMQSFLFVDGAEVIQGERVRYHVDRTIKRVADADPEYDGLDGALRRNFGGE